MSHQPEVADGRRARSVVTRAALVDAAWSAFARRGFDATSIDDVARGARVTKGGVYHHFANKVELFAAVYERLEDELSARLLAAASRKDATSFDALRTGCHEFLRACREPRFYRIAIEQAPAVLGWQRWREIDAQFGLGLLQKGVEAVASAGELKPNIDCALVSRLLLAALMEAAMLLASAEDPTARESEITRSFDDLLDGLRIRPTN